MSWNLLYAIDALSFLFFAGMYYRNCYRKGYRIDFWNSQIFLYCVIPVMCMLPFERDDLNRVIVGNNLPGIIEAMPKVFLIVTSGFLALYVGGSLWRVRLGVGLRAAASEVLNIVPRCSMMILSSRDTLVALSLGCLSLQTLILSIYFAHAGFGFDLRAYTFENPGLRPFALITALTTVIVASHCLARYVDTKEKVLLLCTLLLSFGLLFFGQRTNIALIYLNVGLCYLVKLRNRISLVRIVAMAAGAIVMGFYLASLRDGQYDPKLFLAGLAFMAFYGNTFCDMRDFAWIYSNWNHHLWLGRTYLAGVATFVPRDALRLRENWTFGVATNWTVGIDTQLHPGLKPGLFGESFFNFGWLGSIFVGIVFGMILRRVDLDVKAAFESQEPSMRKAFASTTLLTVAGCFNTSLGIPALYAFFGVSAMAWVGLQIREMIAPARILPQAGQG